MEEVLNKILEEINRLYHENEGNGLEVGEEGSYIAGYTNACDDIENYIKKIKNVWKILK